MAKLTEAQLKVSLLMQELAAALDTTLQETAEEKLGFCLVIFNEQDDSYTQYISNVDTKDAEPALKALLEYWESGAPHIPAHLRH